MARLVHDVRRLNDASVVARRCDGYRSVLRATTDMRVRNRMIGLFVRVNNALAVLVLDETGSGARACGECKPKRGCQHAKQMQQSEQLTYPQSLCFGQACQQTRIFPSPRRFESYDLRRRAT